MLSRDHGGPGIAGTAVAARRAEARTQSVKEIHPLSTRLVQQADGQKPSAYFALEHEQHLPLACGFLHFGQQDTPSTPT